MIVLFSFLVGGYSYEDPHIYTFICDSGCYHVGAGLDSFCPLKPNFLHDFAIFLEKKRSFTCVCLNSDII